MGKEAVNDEMEGNEGQRLEIKIGEGSKERLGIKRGSREDSLEIYKKRQRGKNDGKTKKEKKREARLTRALPLYASYGEISYQTTDADVTNLSVSSSEFSLNLK